MGFLTGKKGMSAREAREILSLDEAIDWCTKNGLMPLDVYAKVFRVRSELPASWERDVQRLKAELREVGLELVTHGTFRTHMTVDFLADKALRAHVARSIDEAQRVRAKASQDKEENPEDGGVCECVCHRGRPHESPPPNDLAQFYSDRVAIVQLARRFGIGADRVRKILRALGAVREPRRLRVEELRSDEIIRSALEARGYGRIKDVARILGVHRNTARAFLRRMKSRRRACENERSRKVDGSA